MKTFKSLNKIEDRITIAFRSVSNASSILTQNSQYKFFYPKSKLDLKSSSLFKKFLDIENNCVREMFQNMRKYEIPKLLFFSLMNAKNPETFSWGKK